ncbi:hypothetical protein N836_29430 [Leptolyngbya sp. Heron Island J]|nr:hypothetical protein N836_29430 [Leptolyngbya sp. Heron Island J]
MLVIAHNLALDLIIPTSQFGSAHYGQTNGFVKVALQRQTARQPLLATFRVREL